MQTLYVVPKNIAMANWPDRQSNRKQIKDTLAFIQEKPEAVEIMALDQLTERTLGNPMMTEWEKALALSDNLQKFTALKAQTSPEQPPPIAFQTGPPLPPPPPPIPNYLLNPGIRGKPKPHSAPVTALRHPEGPPPHVPDDYAPQMEVEHPRQKNLRKRTLSESPGSSPVATDKGAPLLYIVSGERLTGHDAATARAQSTRTLKPARKRGIREVEPIEVSDSCYETPDRRTRGKTKKKAVEKAEKAKRGWQGTKDIRRAAILDNIKTTAGVRVLGKQQQ
ncbi:hypothetical protein RvY_03103 [Ramazzottius varieornatus]|uniref:Uncharacterized protein n=1 Tax=Ramazzottius varieornatus TaxID=947166 RepID=A0A1D1UQP8_RAMVA|nr:hypothetical protein RvY_03103 [Ramazzottius varieornatus]